MKKIVLFLLFMFMPVIIFGATVTTVDEYKAAMADATVSDVILGADITIKESDVLYNEYEGNGSVKKIIDLNGHVLTQEDEVRMDFTFNTNYGTFTITDTEGGGKLVSYRYFAEIHNEREQSLIKLENFDYENSGTGNAIFYSYCDEPVLLLVDNVNFYYPKNSPLSNGFDVIVKSLTVTETDDNPVGFYNDDSTHYIKDVVDSNSIVYVGDYYQDDWDTTLARNVFLGSGAIGKKIVIKDHCTVSFETNGGSEIEPVDVRKGTEFLDAREEVPTKDGYRFFNWYKTAELTEIVKDNFVINRDVTVYAKWAKYVYLKAYNKTLQAESDGGRIRHPNGSESFYASGYCTEGESLTFEAIPLPGMIFVGWAKDDPNGEIVISNDQLELTYTGDINGEYYAVFEQGIDVSFETNGGSEVESQTIKRGTMALEPKDPTREGYSFDGWYTDNTYQTQFDFDTAINEDTLIYAKWLKHINEVNVTFTKPYATLHPDFNFKVANPNEYEIDSYNLYEDIDGYPNLNSESVYELGHEYTYRIAFVAKPGYKFVDSTIYKFNGEISECYGANWFRQMHYTAEEIPPLTNPKISLSANNNSLTIKWNSQLRATKYILYRSTDNKKWSNYKTVTATSFVDKSLTYNKTYYYKLKACENNKCSGYSNVVKKKVVPNKVNLSIASAGTKNIKLSWVKVSTTGYEVYRSTDNKKWSKIKTITKNTTLTYNNTKLTANKTYYYKVRAYKTVGKTKVYGPWSSVVSTKTAPVTPTLKLSIRNYHEINIIMGEAKGAKHYLIYRSFDNKSYTRIHDLPGPGTMADGFYEFGKTVYYKIRACNSQNRCSGWASGKITQSAKTPSFSLASPKTKTITVTLNSVDHANGYEIHRSTSKGGKYTLVKTLSSSSSLKYNNGTKKGYTYYYKVRSYVLVDGKKVYSPFSSVKSLKSK